jgi:polysaccharide biosynthesis/export protein
MVYFGRCGGELLSFVYKPSRYANIANRKALRFALRAAFAMTLVTGFSLQVCAQSTDKMHPGNNANPPASTFPEPVSNPASAPNTAAPMPAADQSHYFISPGDVLDVSVFGAPDLSQKPAVNSSGNIYMPLINYVHVAGMHVEDAQAVVEQAYFKSGVLKVPHVSIVITSYSNGVVLMGEVGRSGIYPIVGSGKLFDILAEAGGTTPTAGQVVTINHKDGTEPETVLLTSDPVQSLAANVPVQQGDLILVSKAGVIYVVGEVLAPGGFLMDEKGQYTVMKAVAMAHGPAKFAKTSKARIVRRVSGGEQEIPVPLDKILASKAPDIQMQTNDILFIPSNKGKQAAARTVDVAVGLASGFAYYGIYH